MRQLDLFSALQSSTEGIDTEFKSARGGMPGSFWESYSAMANTQGGSIVLGVAEKPTGLVWEGVPDAAQLRTVLWGQLNDRHKVSTNLLRDDDVRTVEDEGRQFVVVNVPRASRLQRPVFVGLNPMTGTYRRADEGDYRCSDDEVRRMLADQSDTPTDSQIVEHFGQPDFDPETVKQYRNRFASRAPDHPWLLLDDAPLLTKLSALRRDRATGLEGATVAGLLMFGRFEALCDALPGFHVDSPQSSPQLGGDSPQLPPNSPNWTGWPGCRPKFKAFCPLLSLRARTRSCRWTNSRASFRSSAMGAGWQHQSWRRWWIAMPTSCNRAF